MSLIETVIFKGAEPGPKLLAFGAIHGDEPCGSIALQRFIDEGHKLVRGTLTLVPICNPKAFAENIRYTEANLNRVFYRSESPTTYEASLAQELIPLVLEADMLLDLHSFHGDGNPYLFLDYDTPGNRQLAQAVDIPQWVVGWPDLYAANPELNSGDTVGFACANGKAAILVECGQHKDKEAPFVAYNCLRRMLHALDVLPFENFTLPRSPACSRMTHVVVCDKDGRFVQSWRNFDEITEGAPVIAYEDGSVLKAPQDGYIILPRNHATKGEEWIYFGKRAQEYAPS